MRRDEQYLIELLGTDTDANLAEEFGVSESHVRELRWRHGIEPNYGRRTWLESEDKLLGKESDIKVAKKLGISHASVRSRRLELRIPAKQRMWTSEMIEELRHHSNEFMARKYGKSLRAVKVKRYKLGIPEVVNEEVRS
jgi:hypothetical protein